MNRIGKFLLFIIWNLIIDPFPIFQLRDDLIFEANRDLTQGRINAEEFLDRLTSEYDKFFKDIEECDVAPLDYYEIDDLPVDPPVSMNSCRNCQFCEDSEAIVVLQCTCQMLCVTCFKEYAYTFTVNGRRPTDEFGNPLVNEQNPIKCPHCQKMATSYIVPRR